MDQLERQQQGDKAALTFAKLKARLDAMTPEQLEEPVLCYHDVNEVHEEINLMESDSSQTGEGYFPSHYFTFVESRE